MFLQMGDVFGLAGRVDDEKQMVAAVGDHQIVENAAALVGEDAVALPPVLQPQHIDRNEPLQGTGRFLDPAGFRADRDLPHMRDIEEAGGRAGVEMLLHDPGAVLHRHVIAGERHHLAAERAVEIVKGCPV